MKKGENLLNALSPVLLFFSISPARAQNIDFEQKIDAKAVFIQIAAKCQPSTDTCSTTLRGDPTLLTEKIREAQELYNISVGCPDANGKLQIITSPILPDSDGGRPDVTRYVIAGGEIGGGNQKAYDLEAQLSQRFRVTRKCEDNGDAPLVLVLEPRASNE